MKKQVKKLKIQRESDKAFVLNPSGTVILPETKDRKAFQFMPGLAKGIVDRLKLLYPKETFITVEV
jgi:Trm5-related predicted tRNA methylase